MITNIKIEHLQGHPKNPRLNVGDVTELADSIKEQGILQNLTVVPSDDGKYTVIIGHRRLEACKTLGLEEVPCAIVEMDEKTQISTMLVENMQRTDLTPYEEAQGIQQCLDLGMSEKEIIKKTGLKRKSIRNRTSILKLDQDKVKVAQGSLEDFIALEEITDVEKRNELLKHMGTNNFNLMIEKAKQPKKEKTDIVTEKEVSKASVHSQLRINFMVELFKQKINSQQLGLAVYEMNSLALSGDIKNLNNKSLLDSIVNPNKKDIEEVMRRMSKHRSNYFIIEVLTLLETLEDLPRLYNCLSELGYVISDEEKEVLNNVEDK